MLESLKNDGIRNGIRISIAASIFAGSLAHPQPVRAETIVTKYGQCAGTIGLELEGIFLPGHNFEITATADSTLATVYSKEDLGIDERCSSKIDPKVMPALQLMVMSPYRDTALALTSLEIFFQPLAGHYAIIYPSINLINLARELQNVNEKALAALLAHEGTHWQDYQKGLIGISDKAACIESEVRAFRNGLGMWRFFYPNGISNPQSQLEVELNNMLTDRSDNPWLFDEVVRKTYNKYGCVI